MLPRIAAGQSAQAHCRPEGRHRGVSRNGLSAQAQDCAQVGCHALLILMASTVQLLCVPVLLHASCCTASYSCAALGLEILTAPAPRFEGCACCSPASKSAAQTSLCTTTILSCQDHVPRHNPSGHCGLHVSVRCLSTPNKRLPGSPAVSSKPNDVRARNISGSSFWSVPDSVPGTLCRDLKAANLLMDDSGIVKIADFGVARVMDTLGVMTAETGTYRWVLLLATRFCSGSRHAISCECMCSRSCCRGNEPRSMLLRSRQALSRQRLHLCIFRSLRRAPARTPCPSKMMAWRTAVSTCPPPRQLPRQLPPPDSWQKRKCQCASGCLQVDGS